MIEQRAYRRFRVELPARYRIHGLQTLPFEVTVVDVGAEGMCLLLKNKIEAGQTIELQVDLHAKDCVCFKTEVMWVKSLDKAGYKAGVKIIDASLHDETRFIKFYCRELLQISEKSKKILKR